MLQTLLHYLLRKFSTAVIKKYRPDVIGITGSIGKTSTKEAVSKVLKAKFSVRANYKNYNNEIGVPLTILGFDKSPRRSIVGWTRVFIRGLYLLLVRQDYPEILVLEMGADKPGDIQYLVNIAPCKVGILTYISHAHTEYFKTIKRIAQEKRIILSHLQSDGFAILNYDCQLVMENASVTKAEKITYGFKEGADLRATDVNIITNGGDGPMPAGLNFKVCYKGNIVPIFMPGFVSKTVIPAALAGIASALVYGMNLVEAAQALQGMEPLPGHMRALPGIKHTLIIDDTYNSSPEPSKAALEVLESLPAAGEKYAVLGDMLELGTETISAHREIGFKVVEHGVNNLITVGEASKATANAAKEAGLDLHRVFSFSSSSEAGKFLQDRMKQGDVILVKGSQGSRMEKVVKEIMAEPLQAPKLLVRQDPFWLEK